MANDQSETPVASAPENGTKTEAPAAAVEAGKVVEGTVPASSGPAQYAVPSDTEKSTFENGPFGDEGEYITEPAPSAAGHVDKTFEPLNAVGGHP
ncbi:hypothetical protein ACFRAR_07105 [Kitasatospora sp. NPDC056651]|uniref:hypothetical protein n=1 Tax=Kitasatospora sp. NPDC056651 TaxID=3345892 RepID=UPI003696F882